MKKIILFSTLLVLTVSCGQSGIHYVERFNSQLDSIDEKIYGTVRDYKFSLDSMDYAHVLDSSAIERIESRASKQMAEISIANAKLNAEILKIKLSDTPDLSKKEFNSLIDRIQGQGLLCSYFIEFEERDRLADALNELLIDQK